VVEILRVVSENPNASYRGVIAKKIWDWNFAESLTRVLFKGTVHQEGTRYEPQALACTIC